MIILDTMVVIHLAKITLLEKACAHLVTPVIPQAVYHEVMMGKEKGHADAKLAEELIQKNVLLVKKVKNQALIKRAGEFNIQRGEAEVLALYWQEKANYLASDDDNVRKKSMILDIRLVGTLALVTKLYRDRKIVNEKLCDSLSKLRRIGWFSNAIIDTILMEVD